MTWPWVSRKLFDEAVKQSVRDMAMREAAIVYEQQGHQETKETLGRMTQMCRDLEAKLQDCKDPPITRKELTALTKRHSFVVARAENLEKHNTELQAQIETLKNGKAHSRHS